MEKKYKEIISFLKEYQERTRVKGYVLGISGGKDSTVVAKLLVDAIGADNVLGVMLPNSYQPDLNDSLRVCKLLGINYMTVNIENPYLEIQKDIQDANISTTTGTEETVYISQKALTNIAPRIRMTILYGLAQTVGYRVAGTGNKSEAFIGWFTKWGDGGCDIDPIAHLTCTEVIELGDYLGLPYDLVHKTPADGLTGKSDEENLGFTYAEIDRLIYKHDFLISTGYVIEPFTDREKEILKMHDRAYHKTSVIKLA